MKDVTRQVADLTTALARVSRQDVPAAAASTMNKVLPRVRSRVVKGVSTLTRVKQKLIRERVYYRRSSPKRINTSLRVYTRGINAINLNPRDTGKGGWKNRRGKGVRARGGFHFPNAFVAKDRNRRPQVFQRTGRKTGHYHHVDVVRVPILDEVEEIAPKVARRVVNGQYQQLFSHELNRRLKRRGLV